MHLFSQIAFVLVLLLGCFSTAASHAHPSDQPVYSRQRANARADGVWDGGSQYRGSYQGYHRGYAPYQPALVGSWYARPYPYHFDYYRQRYSDPKQMPDCPCAKTQAAY